MLRDDYRACAELHCLTGELVFCMWKMVENNVAIEGKFWESSDDEEEHFNDSKHHSGNRNNSKEQDGLAKAVPLFRSDLERYCRSHISPSSLVGMCARIRQNFSASFTQMTQSLNDEAMTTEGLYSLSQSMGALAADIVPEEVSSVLQHAVIKHFVDALQCDASLLSARLHLCQVGDCIVLYCASFVVDIFF